jgi:hypothetical protein
MLSPCRHLAAKSILNPFDTSRAGQKSTTSKDSGGPIVDQAKDFGFNDGSANIQSVDTEEDNNNGNQERLLDEMAEIAASEIDGLIDDMEPVHEIFSKARH